MFVLACWTEHIVLRNVESDLEDIGNEAGSRPGKSVFVSSNLVAQSRIVYLLVFRVRSMFRTYALKKLNCSSSK